MAGAAGWVLAAAGLGLAVGAGALAVAALGLGRHLMGRLEAALGSDDPRAPMELAYALPALGGRDLWLTAQRAAHGRPAVVPMESPLRHTGLEGVRFDLATLRPPALPACRSPELAVRLGPRCRRPLRLSLPLILSGMGWGIALTGEARLALAEAASLTGVALSSGEGPLYPPERLVPHPWIWQWRRTAGRQGWEGDPGADLIELQVGQASEGGTAVTKRRRELPGALRRRLSPGQNFRIRGGLPVPLRTWLARARAVAGDRPVGVKLPASAHVERDLAILVRLGVDVITLDGAGAGTARSAAVLADHGAVPAAVAAARAHRWLVRHGLRHRVSLVVSGHLHDAADLAKLLALGADAVAMASTPLVAMVHGQVRRALPWRAPTALVFAGPGRSPPRLDRDLAAERLVAWIRASQQELALICRGLGVERVQDLRPQHLVANSREVARALGVPWHGASSRPAAPGADPARLLGQALTWVHAARRRWAGLGRRVAAPEEAGRWGRRRLPRRPLIRR